MAFRKPYWKQRPWAQPKHGNSEWGRVYLFWGFGWCFRAREEGFCDIAVIQNYFCAILIIFTPPWHNSPPVNKQPSTVTCHFIFNTTNVVTWQVAIISAATVPIMDFLTCTYGQEVISTTDKCYRQGYYIFSSLRQMIACNISVP